MVPAPPAEVSIWFPRRVSVGRSAYFIGVQGADRDLVAGAYVVHMHEAHVAHPHRPNVQVVGRADIRHLRDTHVLFTLVKPIVLFVCSSRSFDALVDADLDFLVVTHVLGLIDTDGDLLVQIHPLLAVLVDGDGLVQVHLGAPTMHVDLFVAVYYFGSVAVDRC